jgi:hypothetical protein
MSDQQKEIDRLTEENARFLAALEKIENDAACNDPAWRVAHDALAGEE